MAWRCGQVTKDQEEADMVKRVVSQEEAVVKSQALDTQARPTALPKHTHTHTPRPASVCAHLWTESEPAPGRCQTVPVGATA